ncbi:MULTISPECIES: hypothetical protein [Bacteria]|uniref:Uncharacterized protein n=1 Tax=Dermacoccus nishinomiyaensis TaxID=1274 RepID=A0A075JDH5_9MICO|nr:MULTISPECIES: hypothetical protein [Bacteria]AIF39989.1 hypothetical protein HX89_02220 [Dermacoccus nishinomiyaensis]NHC30973.1 hypothetical protein [Dermacoccus nishinomiyaensis]NNB92257.1 hypothetical protein [Corallococcus exiguus]
MSTLGDDIRAQQRRADLLSSDLAQSATDLRTTITTTQWTSGAADHCRSVLTSFARDLDACGDDAASFATDIGRHAASVESHQASVTNVVMAPIDLARDGLSKVGKALHRDESEGPYDYSHYGDWRG